MLSTKQSVLNTFNRVGIDHTAYDNETRNTEVCNRFSGECIKTTQLIAFLVEWVYDVSNEYERGDTHIKVSDFNRIRYFILDQHSDVYSTCID